MNLTIAEQLMHTTVRLECDQKNGSRSTGTGFFFSFTVNSESIPVIITNKHVIENSLIGTFVLTKKDKNDNPILGSHENFTLPNFESLWIKHPDPTVDLAVFPIGPLLNQAKNREMDICVLPFAESSIPTQDVLDSLSGIENVTMIGYPNGIWDQKNNMPIIRRGITATSPKYDYNGLPIFVIDCACFPGSSGSPVLIFDQGGYIDAKGKLNLGGSRLILLGVLYAGPQHVAQGEIQTIDIPLTHIPISLSKIPNNLGFVVKSQKINDFKAILEQYC
jgi:hypothetical protein